MFRKPCTKIRESVYGVLCQSPVGAGQVNFGNGTAFMIAPGVCATAAHVLHVEGDKSKTLHKQIEVIRSPDIGGPMLRARLIAEDIDRDLALIEIISHSDISTVALYDHKIDIGTSCGSLGFPLASINVVNNQISFSLVERFQGAFISAFQKFYLPNNVSLDFYETDSVVYGGSSGCPGFTVEEKVFGMVIGTVAEDSATNSSTRLSISRWVPSMDIIEFAKSNKVDKINVA
ncbi:MAG TPA: serine protease [Chitinophagaceae bacterium]